MARASMKAVRRADRGQRDSLCHPVVVSNIFTCL